MHVSLAMQTIPKDLKQCNKLPGWLPLHLLTKEHQHRAKDKTYKKLNKKLKHTIMRRHKTSKILVAKEGLFACGW